MRSFRVRGREVVLRSFFATWPFPPLRDQRICNANNLCCVRSFSSNMSKSTQVELGILNADAAPRFFIETYGCQMNVNDTDIVKSILCEAGYRESTAVDDAELVLLNTCAIRENAENKIWHRLAYMRHLKKGKSKSARRNFKIGVLGCMAERLKDRLLEREEVDLVVGPDAYRTLPDLVRSINSTSSGSMKMANIQLSLDETYADVRPVREADSVSAFVSVMRGCNNMCSFCVVPFTRGRERSRPLSSIVGEVRALYEAGVKEVTLLGQNVNGFHDTSTESTEAYPTTIYQTSGPGFNNIFRGKIRDRPGARFADLLSAVAEISPEMRVRFTSPHPKDFPPDVLRTIAAYPNICKSIHLPVQSGSTSCLSRMRRGYSRDAFLRLVDDVRSVIPGVSISTDVIAGFCGETEEEHGETLSLMEAVRFDQAFMFAYSSREKTHAARNYEDDVPEETKQRRLREIIQTFRDSAIAKNIEEESGQYRLVLVEGLSTKSTAEAPSLTGRTDGNKRVVFYMNGEQGNISNSAAGVTEDLTGKYALVQITDASSTTLKGKFVKVSTLADWSRDGGDTEVRGEYKHNSAFQFTTL